MQRLIPYSGSPVRISVTLKTKSTGATRPGNVWDMAQNCYVLTTDKVSVDTGKFIPGQFRINPYTVYSKRYNWAEAPLECSGEDATTLYVFTITGPHGLQNLRTLVEGKEPSILSSVGQLDKYALQKAYAKLADSEAGMGENLGELRETLAMLRSPLKSLRDFLLKPVGKDRRIIDFFADLRYQGRRARKKALAAPKAAADTWLEIRYGIMPLIYSVQDLIKLANKQFGKCDPARILSRKSRRPNVVAWQSDFTGALASGLLTYKVYGYWEDVVFANASVSYRNIDMMSMADLLGLSPQFIPETAWELVSKSFVVDWFLDVGTWLGAMRVNPSLTVLGNTVGVHVRRSLKARSEISTAAWPPKSTAYSAESVYTNDYFDRKTNVSLPMLPAWKPGNLKLLNQIDSLALLIKPIEDILKGRK